MGSRGARVHHHCNDSASLVVHAREEEERKARVTEHGVISSRDVQQKEAYLSSIAYPIGDRLRYLVHETFAPVGGAIGVVVERKAVRCVLLYPILRDRTSRKPRRGHRGRVDTHWPRCNEPALHRAAAESDKTYGS